MKCGRNIRPACWAKANERRFLEWIGQAIPDSVQKTYLTDQIAALSKGLLDERSGRHSVRKQLCNLTSAGQIAKAATIRNHSWREPDQEMAA
jgi:hypothetical protein